LFAALSADSVVSEIVSLSKDGADATEVIPLIKFFNGKLETAREELQDRFVHYSRMATIGSIAMMLVHEIRNRTTALGSFMGFVKSRFGPFKDKDLETEYHSADRAITALERLADTFAPLATRQFKRNKRQCILEDQIRDCIALRRRELQKRQIECVEPETKTPLAVDPGELDAILLNLIENAIYWLGQRQKDERRILFRTRSFGGLSKNNKRVRIYVQDSGPGIAEADKEKVFWPGVTRRPGGMGMGLTVARELVVAYGGDIAITSSDGKVGTTFVFDLPAGSL